MAGWQSKVLALVKKYGDSAKFAANTILSATIPGSPVIVALVESAFDAAQKTAQNNWEINLSKQVQTTADNQARLDQMLDILSGDLQHLFAQVANFDKMPEVAQKLVEQAKESDARLQEAARKLDGVAHRFDHLDQLIAQLYWRIKKLEGTVAEITGSPAAAAVAKARQMAVTGVTLTVQRCVVDGLDKTLLLEAEVRVVGTGHAPVPYRTVYFFLNGNPLTNVTTDDAGVACIRDPLAMAKLKFHQNNNLLSVRVEDTSKAAATHLPAFTVPEVVVESFDPREDIGDEESAGSVRLLFRFSGTVVVQLNPANFLDVSSAMCYCSINDHDVEWVHPDREGRARIKFEREWSIRRSRYGDRSGAPPYNWSTQTRNKIRVYVVGMPDWYSHEERLS